MTPIHEDSPPLGLPRCPDCGADMVGYMREDLQSLLWSCRGCGATFSTGLTGELRRYPTELLWPICPDCSVEMVAQPDDGLGYSWWRCPNCNFRLTI